MLGKGVVGAMLAILASVQGLGAQALSVQDAACGTLQSLAMVDDHQVRVRVRGRFGFGINEVEVFTVTCNYVDA